MTRFEETNKGVDIMANEIFNTKELKIAAREEYKRGLQSGCDAMLNAIFSEVRMQSQFDNFIAGMEFCEMILQEQKQKFKEEYHNKDQEVFKSVLAKYQKSEQFLKNVRSVFNQVPIMSKEEEEIEDEKSIANG